MTAFQGAVDATFAAFGIDAVYTPAGGEPVSVRVLARRPDAIVGFGETRIHAGTAIFELWASEVADPRPDDQFMLGSETFVSRANPSGATRISGCGRWTATGVGPFHCGLANNVAVAFKIPFDGVISRLSGHYRPGNAVGFRQRRP